MKRFFSIFLAAALLLTLAACGGEQGNDGTVGPETTAPVQTTAPDETIRPQETTAPVEQPKEEGFSFLAEGVKLIPGTAFDAAALPKTEAYTIPSCAFQGTDNVYNYEAFEIIAYNQGEGEVIYSIYFIEPTVATPEGLMLGDEAAKVTQLYGEGTVNGTEITYQKGNTLLIVIVENDCVSSIEYREAVS